MTVQAAIGLAATCQTIAALAVGFTEPSNPLRPAAVVIILLLTWLFDHQIQDGLNSRIHVALLSTTMWIQSLKVFDDLCLTRLSFEGEIADHALERKGGNCQPTSAKTKRIATIRPWETFKSQFAKRLVFAVENLWNMRGIGTKMEIATIPPWSSEDLLFVPSRNKELKRHIRNLILSYLILDLFANQPLPDLEMISHKRETLLGRIAEIGTEEVIFRFFATLGFWVNTFCVIQFINSAVSLFYIGLYLYPIEMTPPIWGKLSDAYSVRQFWGKTWHQTIRRPLVHVSEFFVHTLLNIEKGSLQARYCKLITCFFLSGALHFPADLSLGITSQESNAIQYFLTTALIIMFEDFIQYWFRQLAGGQSKWSTYIGYAWVCFYMYWMTPSWAYPAARVVQSKDQLVPISIISKLIF
jgi:hypothetical protein